MKFIHVADLHIDTPFIGIAKSDPTLQQALIQAPFTAFKRCVSIAINQKVDFVVIVGDLFDGSKQTIAARHFLYKELERLEKVNIPVIISHGNHDYIRLEQSIMKFPNNVFVFRDESIETYDFTTADGETVAVHGFSYVHRWIKENKVLEFPNRSKFDFEIGLLHGDVLTNQQNSQSYAPFTVPDLLAKNYDYWALGHIHQALQLNEEPRIQYSGTIQGKHRNEIGDKGAFLIELNKNQPTTSEFISLAPIVWENATIICQKNWQEADLIREIQLTIDNYYSESTGTQQSYLISIVLENAHYLGKELLNQIIQGELLDIFQTEPSEIFVKVIKISLSSDKEFDLFNYDKALDESYKISLEQLNHGELYQELISDISHHTVSKKWLKDLFNDGDLRKEMIEQAHQRLERLFDTVTGVPIHED